MEYFGPVSVKEVEGEEIQMRGLFADTNIKKGEFVLVEKAFATSKDNDMDEMQ